MITGFLINLIYGVIWVITSPVRLLPNVSLPANFVAAITTANTYISPISFVFPIYTLVSILVIMFGMEAAIVVWKLINWGLHKIPGIS